MQKKYTNITIKKAEKSTVEITGTIPTETFESFREKALKNINEQISIDGFRKGHIPEKILVEKVGEMAILEEMAELAIAKAYPLIVVDEKIDAIGRPEIQITKIAAANPLEFRIMTAVVPEFEIGDYKKIAADIRTEFEKKPKSEVTEKEVDEAIEHIQKSHAQRNHSHDESHAKMSKEEHDKAIKESMPALDDAFVQSVGDFKDVADFKEKIKSALAEDKVKQEKEKLRIEISDKIMDATKIEIPEIMVRSEIQRIEAQFNDDVTRMGISFDDYLKHAKKTLEEIRKEWAPLAEKKAKLQLILNKISQVENIKPEEKEIEEEVGHILAHYADADKERVHTYAESVLMNEKVFQFLEEQK